MKKSSTIGIGLLVIVVVLLLVFVRNASEPKVNVARVWQETDVLCLPFGHQNLAQHFHPHIAIKVDGENESVPANVGLSEACMSEVHTHDASGQIHIETATPNKAFTLLDYFAVRGTSIEREGYMHQVFVDGQSVDPVTYVLEDLDSIEVHYTSD